jgi:hypothetical protein
LTRVSKYGLVIVILDKDRLVLLSHHFSFVETVQHVDLLQVELELVFITDDNNKMVKPTLLLVKLHAKCREVCLAATVPVGVEFLFEDLARLDVERAPTSIKMLKDLDGGSVAIGSTDMLQL